MNPARWPREDALSERLLAMDASAGTLRDLRLGELTQVLRPADLLVLNDAATLPGSLAGRSEQGEPLEARLLAELPSGAFRAVLFGAGDWRVPTEHRPAPPQIARGARIVFGDLEAAVESVSPLSPRLVELRFDRQGTRSGRACTARGARSSTRTPKGRWRCGTSSWGTRRVRGRPRCRPQGDRCAGSCSWRFGRAACASRP